MIWFVVTLVVLVVVLYREVTIRHLKSDLASRNASLDVAQGETDRLKKEHDQKLATVRREYTNKIEQKDARVQKAEQYEGRYR